MSDATYKGAQFWAAVKIGRWSAKAEALGSTVASCALGTGLVVNVDNSYSVATVSCLVAESVGIPYQGSE